MGLTVPTRYGWHTRGYAHIEYGQHNERKTHSQHIGRTAHNAVRKQTNLRSDQHTDKKGTVATQNMEMLNSQTTFGADDTHST